MEHALEEVRILPSTGEFVHPGEAERLKAFHEATRQKEAQRQGSLRVARQAEKDRAARLAAKVALVSKREPLAPPLPQTTAVYQAPVPPTPPRPAVIPIEPTYTCRICGCQTRDWVIRYGNTGQCMCRACAR